MLDTVYAYRVESPPYESTRWRPFRVGCTADATHSKLGPSYWVKVRPNRQGAGRDAAAALISEVTGLALASVLGFRTHTAALVIASRSFASAVTALEGYPLMADGPHFGTAWLDDVMVGHKGNLARHAALEELVRLWVLDCWLHVLDRATDGNVLFLREQGRTILIPSDHSDCFGGADRFTGAFLQCLASETGPVGLYPGVEQELVMGRGCAILEEVAASAPGKLGGVADALGDVPGVWWHEADLTPDLVLSCLRERAGNLCQICRMDYWQAKRKEVNNAISGGKLL